MPPVTTVRVPMRAARATLRRLTTMTVIGSGKMAMPVVER